MIADKKLMNLYEAARWRRREAHRPGTRRNLVSAQKLFLQFCLKFGIPMQEPTLDDLSAYVEWLIEDGLAPSTIKNYLSAVKNLFLLWNITDVIHIFDSYRWSLTLKAIAYANRNVTDKRTAVTLPHLLRLVRLCDSDMEFWPLKIALIFGYLGYVRVSNLAPYTASTFDVTRHTTRGDVWPSEDGVILALKWTKTRQVSQNRVPVPLPALGRSELCPLRAWREYSSLLGDLELSPNDPILLATCSTKGKIVTIPMLRALLRRAALKAGLADQHYTPHSLRRGGASFSFHVGIPLEHIRFHGTWKSNAVEGYLLSLPQFNTPVAKAFFNVLQQ